MRCPESFVDTWWIRLASNGIQMHKGHLNDLRVPEARVPGSRDLTGMFTCLVVLQLRAPCERRRSLDMTSIARVGLCSGTLSLTFYTRTGSCCLVRS